MTLRFGFLSVLLCAIPAIAASAAVTEARQMPAGFGDGPSHELVVAPFADSDVSHLLAALDARLASTPSAPDAAEGLKTTMWDFGRHLQTGRLLADQETQILAHLDDASRTHPDAAPFIEDAERVVRTLTVGKTAPDIVGTDLDGQTLRLSDYRGKVVALLFSGEWCGICRSEYPYERFLLDQYKTWPFALLTVNSDADAGAAKQAYAARGLTFRSWFDGDGRGGPRGPIASAWDVNGWPTAYLIDGRGVIRFVNLRQEDLLKGVRQLLVEQVQLDAAKIPSR